MKRTRFEALRERVDETEQREGGREELLAREKWAKQCLAVMDHVD